VKVYLGLGSNLGPRLRNLSAARRRLRQKGFRIMRQSRVIETEPWGVTDQPRFLTRRWGPRVVDIDILLFGDQQVRQRDLVIPHPHISERQFVLQSLDELGVSLGARS
jgi:7,8-dihydro-6-hydroxymethylpterin-pyrophosphokinase